MFYRCKSDRYEFLCYERNGMLVAKKFVEYFRKNHISQPSLTSLKNFWMRRRGSDNLI